MGIAGEFVLIKPRDGIAEAGEPVSGLRYGEKFIVDDVGFGVVLDEEPFFAAFDVMSTCAVAEAEALFGVDDVEDLAEVDRPESERMSFDGNCLPWFDDCFGIGDTRPAEVKLLPALKGCFGGFKGRKTFANLAASVVTNIPWRNVDRFRAVLGVKGNGVVTRQLHGVGETGFNLGGCGPAKGEHPSQYGMASVRSECWMNWLASTVNECLV